VTVQRAYLGGGVIPPRRLGDGGAGHRSRPRGRNSVPRRNEPRRTDCRSLRTSYTARHRARSTTTHRPQKGPRTARKASNYHADRDIAITGLREARRPLNTAAESPAIAGRMVSSTGEKSTTHVEGSDKLPRTDAETGSLSDEIRCAAGHCSAPGGGCGVPPRRPRADGSGIPPPPRFAILRSLR
jgi:hypothetical protein